jgi:predicted TIM-barrel fold metal-dependent hydrolase
MTRPCPGAPAPTAPATPPPTGACDCHLHVFGPFSRYPLAAERPYTPPEAALADLRQYMTVMGLSRVVIAQPSAYGLDMAATLDAIAALGPAARGAAMVPETVSNATLAAWHEAGIRSARLSASIGHPATPERIRSLAARIAPFGWSLAIWPESPDELSLLATLAGTLPVPLILDHFAARAWEPGAGLEQPGFRTLRDMLASGRVWLKLSAPSRADAGPPPWPALLPYAATLIRDAPERLLWASDWPHVGHWHAPTPPSGALLDFLCGSGGTQAAVQQILVDNPARLYDFGSISK